PPKRKPDYYQSGGSPAIDGSRLFSGWFSSATKLRALFHPDFDAIAGFIDSIAGGGGVPAGPSSSKLAKNLLMKVPPWLAANWGRVQKRIGFFNDHVGDTCALGL